MVEIKNKLSEIEKIDTLGSKVLKKQDLAKLKIDKLIDRKDSAKSFLGYLRGCVLIAKNDKNIELTALFEDLIERYKQFNESKSIDIEIIEGWKGKDTIEIYKGFENNFRIKEHFKDKDTKEVTEHVIEVQKHDLNRILWIVKGLSLNESISCYQVAEKLKFNDWKSLWKERKLYFSQYYYPIKVLEALKLIKYSGRGKITRIK